MSLRFRTSVLIGKLQINWDSSFCSVAELEMLGKMLLDLLFSTSVLL